MRLQGKQALEAIVEAYDNALTVHIYDEDNGEKVPDAEHALVADARLALLGVADATERQAVSLKHFESPEAALGYLFDELLATLTDDLRRAKGVEREDYTDADRTDMKAKIDDLRTIEPHVKFVP